MEAGLSVSEDQRLYGDQGSISTHAGQPMRLVALDAFPVNSGPQALQVRGQLLPNFILVVAIVKGETQLSWVRSDSLGRHPEMKQTVVSPGKALTPVH